MHQSFVERCFAVLRISSMTFTKEFKIGARSFEAFLRQMPGEACPAQRFATRMLRGSRSRSLSRRLEFSGACVTRRCMCGGSVAALLTIVSAGGLACGPQGSGDHCALDRRVPRIGRCFIHTMLDACYFYISPLGPCHVQGQDAKLTGVIAKTSEVTFVRTRTSADVQYDRSPRPCLEGCASASSISSLSHEPLHIDVVFCV